MAGYDGYSMSNNAVAAYNDGYAPKSAWTKKAVMEKIWALVEKEQGEEVATAVVNRLKKIPIKYMVYVGVLQWRGWHHTSKKYNRTDFYGLSDELIDAVDNLDALEEAVSMIEDNYTNILDSFQKNVERGFPKKSGEDYFIKW